MHTIGELAGKGMLFDSSLFLKFTGGEWMHDGESREWMHSIFFFPMPAIKRSKLRIRGRNSVLECRSPNGRPPRGELYGASRAACRPSGRGGRSEPPDGR